MSCTECKLGGDCIACEGNVDLGKWESVGVALIIVCVSLLSAAILVGGTIWGYNTLVAYA